MTTRHPNPGPRIPRGVSRGRPPSRRLIGNLGKRGGGATNAYHVEIQGANALIDHFLAMSYLIDPFATQLIQVVGEIGVEEARRMVPYRTGETYDSFDNEQEAVTLSLKPGYGEWQGAYGPTTFYSPFLEYGTVFMEPRPFMNPSADIIEPLFVTSVAEFADMLATTTGGSGFGLNRATADPRIKGSFTGVRSMLYDAAKALGDLSIFGGRSFLGPIRSSMYSLARGLGDVSSIMNRTISQRVSNRLRGRVTGRIIGFGSASLNYSRSYNSFVGGAAGHRIYQRIAGRYGSINFTGAVQDFVSGR